MAPRLPDPSLGSVSSQPRSRASGRGGQGNFLFAKGLDCRPSCLPYPVQSWAETLPGWLAHSGGAHGPRVFSECHPLPARCRTEAPLANPGGALLCLVTIAEINTEHLGRGPGVGPSTSSVTPAQLGKSQPRPTVLGAECLPLVSLFSLISYPRNPFQSGGL